MQFLDNTTPATSYYQSTTTRTTTQAPRPTFNAPLTNNKHIVTEDYYYYQDDNGPPQKEYDDYEYYSDSDELKRRVLNHAKGKQMERSRNNKSRNVVRTTKQRQRADSFSTSFLPHFASSSSLLYSFLPAPPLQNRRRPQSVRPWWSNAISRKKQQWEPLKIPTTPPPPAIPKQAPQEDFISKIIGLDSILMQKLRPQNTNPQTTFSRRQGLADLLPISKQEPPSPIASSSSEKLKKAVKVSKKRKEQTRKGRKTRKKALRRRNRYGIRNTSSPNTTEETLRTLIENVFQDLDEMDTLATTTTTTTQAPAQTAQAPTLTLDGLIPLGDILTPTDYDEYVDYDYNDYVSSDDWQSSLSTDTAMDSWRQKLHVAKLAAWMKAKAQMEASDLASNIMQMEKNTDDHDILPQGEESKPDDDKKIITTDVLQNLQVGTFDFYLNETQDLMVEEEKKPIIVRPTMGKPGITNQTNLNRMKSAEKQRLDNMITRLEQMEQKIYAEATKNSLAKTKPQTVPKVKPAEKQRLKSMIKELEDMEQKMNTKPADVQRPNRTKPKLSKDNPNQTDKDRLENMVKELEQMMDLKPNPIKPKIKESTRDKSQTDEERLENMVTELEQMMSDKERDMNNETSSGVQIPLMNIDGVNFGSDDYYNDFYDDEFPLVDDAIIPYEDDSEWLVEDGESTHPKGIIIHDGSHHHHHEESVPHYSTTTKPHHDSFDHLPDTTTKCFLPPCIRKLPGDHAVHHNKAHHHSHHQYGIKTVYPQLIPRPFKKLVPHLLPKPTPPPPPPLPPYIPSLSQQKFEPSVDHNSIDLNLDVAHHGSIGVHVTPSEISISPPSAKPFHYTTTTTPSIAGPITYSTTTPPTTSSIMPKIVVHSSTSTTTEKPIVVLLQKKKDHHGLHLTPPYPSKPPVHYVPPITPHSTPSTIPPGHYLPPVASHYLPISDNHVLTLEDHHLHPATPRPTLLAPPIRPAFDHLLPPTVEYPDDFAPPFSFSSIFLPQVRSDEEEQTSIERYDTTELGRESTTTVEEGDDSFRLSVLVPCNDPDTGQEKKCLLVKKEG